MNTIILIASDGGPGADGALRLGSLFARSEGAEVRILGVLPPAEFSALTPPEPVPAGYVVLDEVRQRDLRLSLERQVERVAPTAPAPRISVETGLPAATIAARAAALEASLILVGAGGSPRDPVQRQGDLALRIAHLSDVPVVAVPTQTRDVPWKVLAGIDFGRSSIAAAHAAARMMINGGHLYLLHVTWEPTEVSAMPSLAGWKHRYDLEAEARLKAIARELDGTGRLRVGPILAHGDAASQLLDVADRLGVDLIALGDRGTVLANSHHPGEVTIETMRRARSAVLSAPAPPAPAAKPDTPERWR